MSIPGFTNRPYLTMREIELVAEAFTGPYAHRNALAFRLMVECGLGQVELQSLTFAELFDGARVVSRITVRRRRRGGLRPEKPLLDAVPLPPAVQAVARQWRADLQRMNGGEPPAGPVMCSRKGKLGQPVTRQHLWHAMTRTTAEVLGRRYNPMALEWTYMVNGIRRCTSLEQVQRYVRSSSTQALLRAFLVYIGYLQQNVNRARTSMEISLKELCFLGEDSDG
jgi:hypothetical protein